MRVALLALMCCVGLSLPSEAGQRAGGQGLGQARGSQGTGANGTSVRGGAARAEGGRPGSSEAATGQPAGGQGGYGTSGLGAGAMRQAPFTSKLVSVPQRPTHARGYGRGSGGWGPGLGVPFDPFWWSAPAPEADAVAEPNEFPRPPSPDFTKPPPGPSLIQPAPARSAALAITSSSGVLRLNVQPGFAQLYVDGFYVGTVSEFGTATPGLALPAGWHRLEFRAAGYFTPAVNVTIDADRMMTYEGALQPTTR